MKNRLPNWVVNKIKSDGQIRPVKRLLRSHRLHTVCEEARCPNIGECFERGTATFLIMGPNCTRACGFCSVGHGDPLPLKKDESDSIANMVKVLGLKHAVITSVTRDDLEDGGAGHFIDVIVKVRRENPDVKIEVLIPDFNGKHEEIRKISCSSIDILNHNIETVPRLYPVVRPQADFKSSLQVLRKAKHF